MTINFHDTIALDSKPSKTHDGYLVATARVARTGIQIYSGNELGKPEMDVVRVYRPESEVFNDKTMQSFAYRPMTNDHPSEMVTAENWKGLSIGQVGGEVARDGEFIRVPLVMMDAAAIKDYENGKRELSMGYSAEIVFDAGTTPDGEEYDAIQKNIRNNHLALVDKARAGKEARIGDNGGHRKPAGNQTEVIMTKKIIHDGITIEVSEQAAEVIAELNKRLTEAAEKATESESTEAEQDAKIEAKDAEIQALKDAQLTADQLDAVIAERVELISKAKTLVDKDYKGSAAEIKKEALVALIGDSVSEKSEAYIDARFDIELEKVKVGDSDNQTRQPQGDADAKYRQKLADAWKGK